MKPGSLVLFGPQNKLGIVGYYQPQHMKEYGVRITTEANVAIAYSELPEVTEYTPEVCAQLVRMLPRTPFSVNSKDMGMTGTDPEIFAFDKKGAVIPAWKWLKHKSEDPSIYWDGFQAEFVTSPTTCHNYQTDNVRNQLQATHNLLKAYNKDAYLDTKDVVRVDRKTLLTEDDKYIELGCSPSRNAYPNVKPIEIVNCREHPYRYSGCHIHNSVLDYTLPSWFPEGTVAMIDKVAGVMLTALGRDLEDPERRKAYGRAGEFRVPAPVPCTRESYGDYYKGKFWQRLEYRTPGSFLLKHPALFNFACDTIRWAFRMGLLMDGRLLGEVDDVQGIINNCDADAAVKMITAKDSFHSKVLANMGTYYAHNKTMAILEQGAEASGLFDGSVYENWKLGKDWHTDNMRNGATRWDAIILGTK